MVIRKNGFYSDGGFGLIFFLNVKLDGDNVIFLSWSLKKKRWFDFIYILNRNNSMKFWGVFDVNNFIKL